MHNPPLQIRWKLAPHHLLLLAIVVGGFVLRIGFVGRPSLWLDESVSWRLAHFSLHDLWHLVLDTHPPLYYSLLHLWLQFGDSEAALRFPSVVGGTVSIALVYLLGRRVADTRVGLIAALLVAASAAQIDYSREARSYALLTMTGLMVSIGLVEILTASAAGLRPRIGSFIWYVTGMVAALYLHNIAVLLFVLTFAVGAAEALRRRSRSLATIWLIATGAVLVGWLWWLPVALRQGTGSLPELDWLKPPDLHTGLNVLALVGGPNVYFLHSLAAVLFAAIAAMGLASRPRDMRIAYIAAAAVGLSLAEIVISLAGRPIFMVRTIVWLGPYFSILIARAFVGLRWQSAAAGVGLLLALELIGVRNYYQKEDPEPWRQTVRAIAPQLCSGDVMIVEPYYIEPIFTYYFPHLPADIGAFAGYVGHDIVVDPRRIQRPLRNMSRDEAGILSSPRIWLITRSGGDPEAIEQTTTLLMQHHAVAERHETPNLSADLFVAPDVVLPCDKAVNP